MLMHPPSIPLLRFLPNLLDLLPRLPIGCINPLANSAGLPHNPVDAHPVAMRYRRRRVGYLQDRRI